MLWIRIAEPDPLLTSIWIRILGIKLMRIHVDPDLGGTLSSQKVEFLHEKYTIRR